MWRTWRSKEYDLGECRCKEYDLGEYRCKVEDKIWDGTRTRSDGRTKGLAKGKMESCFCNNKEQSQMRFPTFHYSQMQQLQRWVRGLPGTQAESWWGVQRTGAGDKLIWYHHISCHLIWHIHNYTLQSTRLCYSHKMFDLSQCPSRREKLLRKTLWELWERESRLWLVECDHVTWILAYAWLVTSIWWKRNYQSSSSSSYFHLSII